MPFRMMLLVALLTFPPLSGQEAGNLTITVTGLKVMGDLRVSLFDKKEGFPGDYQKARAWKTVKVTAATVSVTFEKLPPGTYAVAMLHDENGNGKVDTNFLGIPKEGVGVSNNYRSSFGPPSFDDAKFSHDGKSRTIFIKMLY